MVKYIFYIIMTLALIRCGVSNEEISKEIEKTPFGEILMEKEIYNAGTLIDILIKTEEVYQDVNLVIESVQGIYITTITATSLTTQYLLPSSISSTKGIINLSLLVNDVLCDTKDFKIQNDKPIGIIPSYLGPKSIRVGGEERSMLVAIPMDTFGNLIENEIVQFNKTTPSLGDQEINLNLENGAAALEVVGQNKVGIVYLGAKCQNAYSKEENLKLINDFPKTFSLIPDITYNQADGRSISSVKTIMVEDEYGNTVSDGTIVNYEFNDTGKLLAKYTALTIKGMAELNFIHSDNPEEFRVSTYINEGNSTTSEIIALKQELSSLDVTYLKDESKIKVGPLNTNNGYVVSDGTRVILEILNGADTEYHFAYTEDGYAYFDLSFLIFEVGSYDLNVRSGGLLQRIKVNYEK